MANRAYLYASDNYPSLTDFNFEKSNIVGISESPYGIPLFMALLCYEPLTLSDSFVFIFDEGTAKCIVADYDLGFQRFKNFINEIDKLNLLNESQKAQIEEAITYLTTNKRKYFTLDLCELSEMSCETIEEINADIELQFENLKYKKEKDGMFVLPCGIMHELISTILTPGINDYKLENIKHLCKEEMWDKVMGIYVSEHLYFSF